MPEGRTFKKRPYGSLKRKINTRELRQRFLIVCEGEKTEPNYFRQFRVLQDVVDYSVGIDVRGLGDDPLNLVRRAIELHRENRREYDQVWCVFDRDSFAPQRFNAAIDLARENHVRVAYSNEAFELWYLLHFHYFNTAIPRSEYIVRLSKELGKKYEKNSRTMYLYLEGKQAFAIANAERLFQQYPNPNPEKDNPSTTVHQLVKELNRFIAP